MQPNYFVQTDFELLESTIITGILLCESPLDEVFRILDVEDFSEKFQPIVRRIIELQHKKIQPDFVTVGMKNEPTKKILMGILDYPITRLTEPDAIIEKATILKGERIKCDLATSFTNDYDIQLIREKMARLERSGSAKLLNKEELMNLMDDSLLSIAGTDMGYPFHLINNATRGIARGQYIVVAGRPSVGKSTFMDNVAEYLARKGKRVLFASAEMSAEMITTRILSRIMKVDLFDMANIKNINKTKFEQAKRDFPSLHCFSFGSVESLERLLMDKKIQFDIVMVDYLQLLEPKKRYRSMYERATFVSNELKLLATRFNIPILVASQFSRVADKEQPKMSDLRDSGAIEQDADVIISLWRDDKDADLEIDKNIQKTRLDLLKNRNGYTFKNSDNFESFLMFKKDEYKFYNADFTREEAPKGSTDKPKSN